MPPVPKSEIALSLAQTLTLILIRALTLTPTLILTLTQTEGKHYFASRGKIATAKYYERVMAKKRSKIWSKLYHWSQCKATIFVMPQDKYNPRSAYDSLNLKPVQELSTVPDCGVRMTKPRLTSVRSTVKNLAQMRFSEWRIIGLAHRYEAWLHLKFEVEIVKVGFVWVKFNILGIVIFYSNLAET